MAAPQGQGLAVERWSHSLQSSREHDVQGHDNIDELSTPGIDKKALSTWRTSLLDVDIGILETISQDKQLCGLLETIVVADDHDKVDPWVVSDLPSEDTAYKIWPRDSSGIVKMSELGLPELAAMLKDGSLQPQTIILRDFQPYEPHFSLCPELASFRERYPYPTPHIACNPEHLDSTSRMARELVELADLAITSITTSLTRLDEIPTSVITTCINNFIGESFCSPNIRETVIHVADERGALHKFSQLRSASMFLEGPTTPYWLENMFYRATRLDHVSLHVKKWDVPRLDPFRVVPNLSRFDIGWTTLPGTDLLAMLSASSKTLVHVGMTLPTITGDTTWSHILHTIATGCTALESFEFSLLREKDSRSEPIDFYLAKHDADLHNYKSDLTIVKKGPPNDSGLSLVEKGPPNDPWIKRFSYKGKDAAHVLSIIVRHARRRS